MNKLKKSLNNNKISFGTWIQIPHPSIIEVIASVSGNLLDWICIDMEHGIIDIESMANLIRTIEKFSITPVVRIPKNDYIWIHRSLDAGAKGIVIPMVKNGEEALDAVKECKYPPEGCRSFGYSRSNNYGNNFEEACCRDNSEISVILQIEHIDAIQDLGNILASKPDCTFVGPLDLAGSMGLSGIDSLNNRNVKNILGIYKIKSDSFNIPTGMHVINPTKKNILQAKQNGYKMIAIGLDTVFLRNKCKDVFKDM